MILCSRYYFIECTIFDAERYLLLIFHDNFARYVVPIMGLGRVHLEIVFLGIPHLAMVPVG